MAPGLIPSTKDDSTSEIFRFQFKKTRLCSFYMEGRCSKGAQCAFAHDISQIETPPDLTKTSLCAKWQQGQCKHTAATCKFAHGKHELRMTPQFAQGRESKKQEKSKKKTVGKDIAQVDGLTDDCQAGQVGKVSARENWLHSQMISQLNVDDGFGLWEEHIGVPLTSLVAPPPGIEHIGVPLTSLVATPPGISSTWKSEPMKVTAMESFTNEMQAAFRRKSSEFSEKLSEKYLHAWDNDRTTVGSNSDNCSSRSHSPSSSLSPRKIYTPATMTEHYFTMADASLGWQEPWSYTNAAF